MSLFEFPSFEDTDEQSSLVSDSNFNSKSRKIAFRKSLKKNNRDASFEEILKECDGLPMQNEAVLIKTNGCSDTGSIYTAISKRFELDSLYLSTWIISRENIQRILADVDSGKLQNVIFVVSKRLKELKKSNYAFLVEEFSKRPEKCKFKVCNSHAKTFSVSTKCGNNFTITGSGNWTENPRIENYIILNDKEALNHNKDWMEEIVNGKAK
jgi:hypothetical protein